MNSSNFLKKRKMQDVSFRDVQEFLDYLPADELAILEKLRTWIFQVLPDAREKLAYNVPFYKGHSNFCFMWPGSIAWGRKTQKGVRLGFTNGYLLADAIHYLDRGDRKQVYYRDFHSVDDLDETMILTYLSAAVAIDEELYRQKIKSQNHSQIK